MAYYDLFGKDLLTTQWWSKEELNAVLDLAKDLKMKYYSRVPHEYLKDKNFIMMFYNTSTRTRLSFETAMTHLGGHAIFLEPKMMRLTESGKKGESIKDTAIVMSRYADGIGIRLLEDKITYYGEGHAIIKEWARHATVPVIDMASDRFHPCQGLTDIFTAKEKLGNVEGKKYVIMWAYSPWARSWGSVQEDALIMSRYGMDVTIAHPPGYDLDPEVMKWVKQNAEDNGREFVVTTDLEEALQGAHVVFPRNWHSPRRYEIGKEAEAKEAEKYKNWKLTMEMLEKYTDKALFMHVMPVDRGDEVDDEVADSEYSVIYDQAENRLHVQKAILTLVMGGRL